MIDFPLLSVLIWLPVAGGVALLAMQALGFPDCRRAPWWSPPSPSC